MDSCENFIEMMSLYIDNALSDTEMLLLEKHLETCEKCAREFEDFQLMQRALSDLPMLELPEGFHERAMAKISDSKKPQLRNTFDIKSFVSTAAAVIVCFVALGSALTLANPVVSTASVANSRQSAAMVMGTMQDSAQGAFSESASAKTFSAESGIAPSGGITLFSASPAIAGIEPVDERVLIKNYSVTIVTSDVKNSVQLLKNYVSDVDGSRISDEYGWISFKADEEACAEILANIHQFGEIRSEFEYASDVTDTINDAAIRYGEKDSEAARLIKLIEKAEKAEDIIILEGRISQLEMEKARFKSTYTTNLQESGATLISISIVKKEVYVEPIAETFSSRIQTAFASSVNFTVNTFEELAVAASVLALPLIIIAFVCAVVFFISKKFAKRGGNDEK